MEEIRKNTEYIKNFSLDDCPGENKGFERVLLQLFGFLGHGKSSFINSCKYVLEDGEFQTYADVTQKDGGNTTSRISYPLTDKIILVDNRGCSVMNGYEKSEIFAQLANLLPMDKFFKFAETSGDLRNRIIEAEKEIKSSDFIFPIFVYSVKNGVNPAEMEDIKELLEKAKILTGIFPVIALTHKINPNLKNVKTAFKNMGAEHIFSLENFTPEDHLKTRGKHEEVLKFYIDVIKDIEFRVGHYGDPEMERQKRKKIVLDYLHDSELKKKEEDLRINQEQQKLQYERILQEERNRLEEERRQHQAKINEMNSQKKKRWFFFN